MTEMSELEQLAEDRDRYQLSYSQAVVAESEAKARCRQLESELRVLKGLEPIPGFEPGSGADEPEIAAPQGSWPNVDHIDPIAGVSSGSLNDLVTEAPRVSRDLLRELVREAVKDEVAAQLPRVRGVPARDPAGGEITVPVDECVSRTYGPLAAIVRVLVARAYSVPQESGWFAAGLPEGTCDLLESLAVAAPHRPRQQVASRSQ
jgi:hypothetical protein